MRRSELSSIVRLAARRCCAALLSVCCQLSLLRSTLSSPCLRSSFVVLVSHYPLLDRNGDNYSARHSWHGIDNNSQVCDAVRESMAPLMLSRPSHTSLPPSNSAQHPPQPSQSASTAPSQSLSSCPPPAGTSARAQNGEAAEVGTAALLLHGHVHRGYSVSFPLVTSAEPPSSSSPASFPIYNPGSSGRSFSAGKRAAAYNVYTITREESSWEVGHGQAADRGCGVHLMNGWRLGVERFVHNGQTFEKEQQGPYTTSY